MTIEAVPKINLDSIRRLEADKRYFLSSTTGQIKEASLWMRFKCAIGLSSALSKVNNLVDAVRTTLLEEAGKSSDTELEADIKRLDVSSNIKGSVLKGLASRFRAANSGAMMRKEAETLARREATTGYMYVQRKNLACGREKDIVPVFRHAFKALVEGELPTTRDEAGRTVLDKHAFSQRLQAARQDVERLLLDVTNDERLEHPGIDRHYARHIVTTFFREDGTRNDNAMSDLLTPDEAFAAHLYNLDQHNGTVNRYIHDQLVKKGRDPIAYAKHIRELCGGDKDLEDIVELGLRNICGTGDNKLRSDEAVANKIAAIKDNLAEAREVEKKFPGFMPEFVEAMLNLAGAAMPKGSIASMAEAVSRADVSKLAKLSSFSGPGSIIAAVDQLRLVTQKLGNPWTIFPDKRADIMHGGPEYQACRRIVQALALAKAGPAARARIANAMHGTACREAACILQQRKDEAAPFHTGPEVKIRQNLFDSELATLDELYALFQPHDCQPESVDPEGITWEQAMEDNDIPFDPIFDAHVATALSFD